MSPIGPKHAAIVRRLTARFAPLAARGEVLLSVQNPLVSGRPSSTLTSPS